MKQSIGIWTAIARVALAAGVGTCQHTYKRPGGLPVPVHLQVQVYLYKVDSDQQVFYVR